MSARQIAHAVSLLLFFAAGLFFAWRAAGGVSADPFEVRIMAVGLGTVCFVQFGVLLWTHRRRS